MLNANAILNKEKARLKKRVDPILLKKLDVRAVGILTSCSVKTPKPRPDGTVGQKWAILGLDDGCGHAEGAAFAKVWEKCSALETKVDSLVLVCGELAHKTTYAKEDAHRENPQVGDLNFTVKEAYPLEEAMPLLSKGLRLRLAYDDPGLKKKVEAIRAVILKNPGTLPVFLDLRYPDGRVVTIDLGAQFRVAVNLTFLSELDKVVPAADATFGIDSRLSLEVREPPPWA